MTLVSLLPLGRDLSLGNLPLALCRAAASLFEAVEAVDDALLLGEQAQAPQFKAVAPVLAMGLYNRSFAGRRTWRAGTGCWRSCGAGARAPRTPRCASSWPSTCTTR